MRVKVDWRSSSKENYDDFCRRHPNTKLSFEDWKKIIYMFNESFRDYILETGEKVKFPFGFGYFSIIKKRRNKTKTINGVEYMNLPVDWQKTREKGKIIYNFNFHTEGYFYGWKWFKFKSTLKFKDLWYFKSSRVSARLLSHYLMLNENYKNLYREWTNNQQI